MKHPPIELEAARQALGAVRSDELPAIAVRALEAGHDSPSLRVLAGLSACELSEAHRLFGQAIEELKLRRPSAVQAVEQLARWIAHGIFQGDISPYEGARDIWQLTLRIDERLPDLDTFVYGASEWPDRPSDRTAIEEGIRLAATELVRRPCAD